MLCVANPLSLSRAQPDMSYPGTRASGVVLHARKDNEMSMRDRFYDVFILFVSFVLFLRSRANTCVFFLPSADV